MVKITFPSRYLFTIGLLEVFSLTGWAPQIHTGFLVSRATQVVALSTNMFQVRDCHPLWSDFPIRSSTRLQYISATPTTP